jgi:hypothetical protein
MARSTSPQKMLPSFISGEAGATGWRVGHGDEALVPGGDGGVRGGGVVIVGGALGPDARWPVVDGASVDQVARLFAVVSWLARVDAEGECLDGVTVSFSGSGVDVQLTRSAWVLREFGDLWDGVRVSVYDDGTAIGPGRGAGVGGGEKASYFGAQYRAGERR